MFRLMLSIATAFGLIFGGAKAVDAVQKGQTDEPLQAMEQWRLQVGEPMQTDVPAENAVLLRTQEQTQLQLRDQTCDALLDPACEPIQEQTQLQLRDQTCDPLLNPTCEPTQDQLQLQDQTCDPLLNPTCEPTQDQLQLQDQDQLHLYETDPQHLHPNSGNGSGDGTCDECVPYLEPGPHGNGESGANNP